MTARQCDRSPAQTAAYLRAQGAATSLGLDDADKAERLVRNLSRRLEQEAPGISASLLEGLDDILTVNRLGLPAQIRRSLACTNSIENVMGTVRLSQREAMAKRSHGAALDRRRHVGSGQGFRRLKAHKQLPILRAALAAHHAKHAPKDKLEGNLKAA